MYDKDGSGTIELPEMIEIIGTLYEMEGVSRVIKLELVKSVSIIVNAQRFFRLFR